MKYIVAVSGGVDSVVLLEKLVLKGGNELIVAHFDHGIRSDSALDATFVAEIALRHGLVFEMQREELGATASEELARTRRYAFLREVAKKHNAIIVTAHHGDDVVETIAINSIRGTGWRGLAVLDSDIVRPLLDMTKAEIIAYAMLNTLEWREDSTNASDAYLRNRIRRKTSLLTGDSKRQLLALRAHQVGLKRQIDDEVATLVGASPEFSRYFFSHLKEVPAIECLRHITHARLTRPQLAQVLIAIKTARAGAAYQAGDGVQFRFTSRNFVIELIK